MGKKAGEGAEGDADVRGVWEVEKDGLVDDRKERRREKGKEGKEEGGEFCGGSAEVAGGFGEGGKWHCGR